MGSGLSHTVVVVAVLLSPTLLCGAAIGAVRVGRWWVRRRPVPPVPAGPPIERIASDVRRLRVECHRLRAQPPGPGRGVRVRAVEGAYVDALAAACQALEVAPPHTGVGRPGRASNAELARVESELRARGLAVDLSEAR